MGQISRSTERISSIYIKPECFYSPPMAYHNGYNRYGYGWHTVHGTLDRLGSGPDCPTKAIVCAAIEPPRRAKGVRCGWCITLAPLRRPTKFGGSGSAVTFFAETHKRRTLGRFHVCWNLTCADPFADFFSRWLDEKGVYKSHRNVIFHLYAGNCGEFSTQPNLNETGICVGVADVINYTKSGYDRPSEYKLTDGRILPCFI